jgi:hypothetical protein
MAAARPGVETSTPHTVVCGPVATSGNNSAKTTNGASTTIRRPMNAAGTREMRTAASSATACTANAG